MTLSRLLPPLLLLLLIPVGTAASPDPLDGPRIEAVDLPPGFPAPDAMPGADFEVAVQAWSRGDLPTARRELQGVIDRRGGDAATRVRAQFLLGWVNARLGHHQQASASFYRVRKLEEHPLTEAASFFEAKADLDRGHPRTAIAECGTYRETWEDGRWYDECLLVEADAHVALRQNKAAIELYEQFLDDHPDDQREETIHLRIARSLEDDGRFEEAARRYRGLYISHRLPLTARQATAGLDRIRSAGLAVDDISEDQLYQRACSLRDAGQHDESWTLYCELVERARGEGDQEGDPALAQRLDSSRHDFLWRNRRYEELARANRKAYDRSPDAPGAGEHLYWAVEGFTRAGLYDEAVQAQEIGLQRFGSHRRFRRTEDRTRKLYAGAGQYDKAREALKSWMDRSGSARRSSMNRFYMAFYAYRAGEWQTAIDEFTPLAEGRSKFATASLFYRGKSLEGAEEWREARADHRKLIKDKPDSWYAVVLRSRSRRRAADPDELARARTGRWPGVPEPEEPLPSAPAATSLRGALVRGWDRPRTGHPDPLHPDGVPARDVDGRLLTARLDGWSGAALLTGLEAPAADAVDAEASDGHAPPPRRAPYDPLLIPPTWALSDYWNPEEGRELWEEFAQEYEEMWPELPVAYELSRCGLGELAGPMLAAVYEEVRDVVRSKSRRARVRRWRSSGGRNGGVQEARWAAILDMNMDAADWRSLFAAAGYPASVSAFALDSINFVRNDRATPTGREVWTLRFPAAYAPHVWRSGWENDVDPLLMLSVMRAESLYKHDAISRAGAMGLVQVMPSTGHKVAALMGDDDFRVDRLVEPETNIRLGCFYLGRLMDRFGEGQFPLAVGSYNGGPHNVGRWLRPKVDIAFEDFVEEIQFVETRTYVKRVIEYYSVYTELYGQEGAWVMLPKRTQEDDPSVINF